MKPIVRLFLLGLLLPLSACSNKAEQRPVLSVTIEPIQYFVEAIVGDDFEVNCIVPRGSSPETYDPSPAQMMKIAQSKAYLMVGYLGFEMAWNEKIRQNNPQLALINLSQGMELISGSHDCSAHSQEHQHEHDSHSGIDPHVWSSPRTTLRLIENIYRSLVQLSPDKEQLYTHNYHQLRQEVQNTDSIVTSLLSNIPSRSFIIYHPALSYLARDYRLTQYSLELGGKEPTPTQLSTVIDQARNQNIRVIFVQQEFDSNNAKIIAQSTGCRIVTINPLAYEWRKETIKIAEALQ